MVFNFITANKSTNGKAQRICHEIHKPYQWGQNGKVEICGRMAGQSSYQLGSKNISAAKDQVDTWHHL